MFKKPFDRDGVKLAFKPVSSINFLSILTTSFGVNSFNPVIKNANKPLFITASEYPSKNNYSLSLISTNRKGIYRAINKGLDTIKKESYYIVIGAGDLLFLNAIKKIEISNILMCQYKLSNSNLNINSLRNLYSGMPYCHNAIIFKFNNIRYSNNYPICGDYDYFIKFIKHERINLSKNKYFNIQISIIFESESGISSKSIFKKNFENLLIIFENLGLKYILIYLLLTIKKLIIRIYD